MRSVPVNRRKFFGLAAAAATIGAGLAAAPARAQSFGTMVDYAAGVPSAASIAAEGHIGVIRYVSERRPGAEWMEGKPLLAAEVEDLWANGLSIVSNYQFGKGPNGRLARRPRSGQGTRRARLGHPRRRGRTRHRADLRLHRRQPVARRLRRDDRALYRGLAVGARTANSSASTPTRRPSTAHSTRASVPGTGNTTGAPSEVSCTTPRTCTRFEIDKRSIDGVGVDLNRVLAEDYGQW